jgi:glycerate 2-kinase
MSTSSLDRETGRAKGAKRAALMAAGEALRRSDPARMVREAFAHNGARGWKRLVPHKGRVLVVGAGKASARMALGLEEALGSRIESGRVIVPDWQDARPELSRITLVESTHPTPSTKGVRATRRILSVLREAGEGDLVVGLFSGGGSALMPLPSEGVTLRALSELNRDMLNSGAGITEINCVRKHTSRVSGGRLPGYARGARFLCLYVSDVVGDDLAFVASGPTVPDPTTYLQAKRILVKRGVWARAPIEVRASLDAGVSGELDETPKPGDPVFRRVVNVRVGSNASALLGAKASLERSGYRTSAGSRPLAGEARRAGERLAKSAMRMGPRTALVVGGETTVTVKGGGRGGRNQELALAAAVALDGRVGVTLLAMGTDGRDGPTEAAGAAVDGGTVARAAASGLDAARHLSNNDSNGFFRKAGGLVVTGPTGTNVNDVVIVIRD